MEDCILKKIIKIIFATILVVVVTPILFVSVVILGDAFIHPDEIPSFFGWKPFIVMTESMQPEIEKGDLIIIKETDPETLEVGDIISYRIEKDKVITHRIDRIDKEKQNIYTKGDFNDEEDRWNVPFSIVEGKLMHNIKKIGFVALFIQSPTGILICITIPILVLFILQLIEDIRYNRHPELYEDEIEEAEVEETEEQQETPQPKKETVKKKSTTKNTSEKSSKKKSANEKKSTTKNTSTK